MSQFKTHFLQAYKHNFHKQDRHKNNYNPHYQYPQHQQLFNNDLSPQPKTDNLLQFKIKSTPNAKQVSQTMNTEASRYRVSTNPNRSKQKNHKTQPSQQVISRVFQPINNLAVSDIEDHLVRENENLKQHRNFLLKQIRKVNKKMKDLKEQNEYLREQYEIIQNQRIQEQQQNYELKMLINQCTKRITGNQQIKNIIKSCVQSNQKQFRNSELMETLQHIPITQHALKINNNKDYSSNYMQNGFRNPQQSDNILKELDTINNTSIQNQINSLNDQFEAMMYEYKTTKNHQIRKKCIQIAWKLKQLKKQERDHESQSLPHVPNERQTFTVNSTHIHQPFGDIHRTVKSSNNNSYNYISSPKFKKKNSHLPQQSSLNIRQSH